MGSFHFPVELRRPMVNIYVPQPQPFVFDMPMKLCLKLVAPVRSDCADPEWELIYYVVHEFDGTILIVFRKDLQSSNTSSIINSCILVPFHGLYLSIFQPQELHV